MFLRQNFKKGGLAYKQRKIKNSQNKFQKSIKNPLNVLAESKGIPYILSGSRRETERRKKEVPKS